MEESKYLILLVAVIYFGIAATQLYRGSWENFIVWFGYSFSNIGLYYLAK